MKTFCRIILFPAFFLVLAACKSEPIPISLSISTPNLLELPDFIYAAGYMRDEDGYRKPCYWYGTNRIELPVPRKAGGSLETIIVVDGTVYAAGNIVY